jgi:DNA-binding CsgD family transcriptional regulator
LCAVGGLLQTAPMSGHAAPAPVEVRRLLVAGSRRLVSEALAVLLDGLPDISAVAVAPAEVADAVKASPVDAVVVPVGDDVDEGRAVAVEVSTAAAGVLTVLIVPPPTAVWSRIATSSDWRLVSFDEDVSAISEAIRAVGAAARRRGRDPATSGLDLSPREVEVLRLLAAGVRPEAISIALNVSQHTVRSHIRNLISKLGVRSQLEAVAEGRRAGYIAPPRTAAHAMPERR